MNSGDITGLWFPSHHQSLNRVPLNLWSKLLQFCDCTKGYFEGVWKFCESFPADNYSLVRTDPAKSLLAGSVSANNSILFSYQHFWSKCLRQELFQTNIFFEPTFLSD